MGGGGKLGRTVILCVLDYYYYYYYYYFFPLLFVILYLAENPAIQTQKLTAFALSLALDPTFGIHSHKTLDTARPWWKWGVGRREGGRGAVSQCYLYLLLVPGKSYEKGKAKV